VQYKEVLKKNPCTRHSPRHARVVQLVALSALAGLLGYERSSAFDYAEHYAITIQSFRQACKNLRDENHGRSGIAAQLCGSERVANCLAHMAAVAGDYAQQPADFQDAKQPNLLKRDAINCRDIGQLLDSEQTQSEPTTVAVETVALPDFASHLSCMTHRDAERGGRESHSHAVLIDGWLDRTWRWVKLAANNGEHFQPQSYDAFKRYQQAEPAVGEPDLSAILGRHAFSMHFLEDSFAAGHIGLDRSAKKRGSWGARQDYGHAYHDDLNSNGQYVQNTGGESWYSYGDRNLCAPTLYVDVAEWMADLNSADKERAIGTVIASAYRHSKVRMDEVRMPEEGKEFAARLVAVIDSLASSSDANGPVASVPIGYPIWAFCSYFVYCNKLELVLVNSGRGIPAQDRFNSCDLVLAPSPDDGGIAIHACLDTKRYVMRAAVSAQRAFLGQLSNTATNVEVNLDAIDGQFPSSYAPLDISEDQRALNSHPLILRSKSFQLVSYPTLYSNSAWGFDVAREQATNDELRDWSLDFGLQARLGTAPVSVRGALLTRHDGHWSLIDQVEAGYDFARLTEPKFRLLSLAPFVHAGLDSIFRGQDARNVYGGVGFGIEADLGRYVLQLRFARELHWNDPMGSQWGSRITFGLKIPSLDLAP
jgi:hypothetical protein